MLQLIGIWFAATLPSISCELMLASVGTHLGLSQIHRRNFRRVPTITEMARECSAEICRLPLASLLSKVEAKLLLTTLGIIGSSIERHAQQALRKRNEDIKTGNGLKLLEAPGDVPFESYFHPHRDSFVSFVEFNSPGVSIKHPMSDPYKRWSFAPITSSNGEYMTFTNSPGEKAVICLLQRSCAAQTAANEFLLSTEPRAWIHWGSFATFTTHAPSTAWNTFQSIKTWSIVC